MLFRTNFTIIFLFCAVNTSYSRNILLILVDDLRPALGSYDDNSAYTPNIDIFAKDSVVFNRAYAQQALCAPSRNSLLTSRRPDTLHLYDFYSYWRNEAGNFTTLPQHFKENGYITKSIGKIFHPGISSNFTDDQPYSWTEVPYHPSTEKYKELPVCWNVTAGWRRNIVCPVNPVQQPEGTLPDLQNLSEAKSFLRYIHLANKPFFLAVGFHKPHIPLKYPKKYLALHPLENVSLPANRFRSYGLPDVAWNPWTDLRQRDDIESLSLKFPFETMPDDWTKRIRQSYYAAVSYIDDLVGQLLQSLKEQEGLFNDTIVALIGDHGWSLGEHGEWSKFSNFEVAVRVPFILSTPEMRERKYSINTFDMYERSDALVELVDLFPTLVQLAGLETIPQCPINSQDTQLCTEGVSLLPLIEHLWTNKTLVNVKWKTGAFSQYPRPGLYPTKNPNSDKPHLKDIKIMGYSIRTRQYRYTEWVPFESQVPDWTTVYSAELYDHVIDPGEDLNLADRDLLKNVRNMLSRQLREGWRNCVP